MLTEIIRRKIQQAVVTPREPGREEAGTNTAEMPVGNIDVSELF